MKSAFLEFLDEKSILFRPHPVDGRAYTEAQEESSVDLTWEPTRAGVSAAGDLGFTTGPYTVEEEGEDPLHGYFISIWRTDSAERWRLAMDLGTENPPGERCRESGAFADPPEGTGAADAAALALELLELERTLAAEAQSADAVSALEPRLTEASRLYRDGRCPARGQVAFRWALSDLPGRLTWDPIDATAARSGDFAYTYGTYAIAPAAGADPSENGSYVRVWSRTVDQPWSLLLQVTSPVPPG
jgi:hypothetical protein